jgi:glycerol-3-phosphate dehydrogenase (NAD(P)+)
MTVSILGAGSFGTAMALHIAKHDKVILWSHNHTHISAMQEQGENTQYLPGYKLTDNIELTYSIDNAIQQAKFILIAVPSHAFSTIITELPTSIPDLAWLSKGIDPTTEEVLSTLVAQKFGHDFPAAIVSGPSFAKEVAQGLPTALTLASNNQSFGRNLSKIFHHHNMRIYFSDDLIGVQLCGAIKNVLAIACGISDGLGFGANAKAALITRGISEMMRLGTKLGASVDTFMSLAGVGDLILTCTDNQSRNRRFGLKLAEGMNLNDASKAIGQVVEGRDNVQQICNLAAKHQVSLPICEEIHKILTNTCTVKEAALNLLARPQVI